MLIRAAEYIRSAQSFAIETTLSGNWTTSAIRDAQERSFYARLFYICVDNSEFSVQRVRERVAQGGHDVPHQDIRRIRRRYARSLRNATQVLRIVDRGLVFDNSGGEPRSVFEVRGGRVINIADEIPAWAAGLLEEMKKISARQTSGA